MTDSRWFDDWMRAWQSFPVGARTAGERSSSPWAAALDHFTKTQQLAYQQSLAEAVDKLTEQSRAFFELGQQLAGSDQADWRSSVLRQMDRLAEQAADPRTAARSFAGVSPVDYWRQFAGHHDASPGGQPSFMSEVDKLLQAPGVGYTREHQEAMAELSRRWLAYEEAYGEYAAYCAETARRSIERLRERLQSEFDQGGGPDSVRGLYHQWVQVSEEVYAERAVSGEYVRLHGRMVNALMSYKQQASLLLDQWAEALNLPTRAEVDALHRNLKATRQELRALKAGVVPAADRDAAGHAARPTKKKRKKKRRKKRAKQSKKP